MDDGIRKILNYVLVTLLVQITSVALVPQAFAKQHDPSGCMANLTVSPHLVPEDLVTLQDIADHHNLEIVVMAPNPKSLRFRSLPGYAAKPEDIKRCKSADAGPAEGLVNCPQSSFANRDEWEHNKSYLYSIGYEVLGPEKDFLVRRISDGKYFFSDYDMFSVRDRDTLAPVLNEDLRAEMNARLGRNLVRHGALADYQHRAQIKIKLPMMVIERGAVPQAIESRPQLERQFAARGLPLW